MSLFQCQPSKNTIQFCSPVSVGDPSIQDTLYDELSPNCLFKLVEDFNWKKAVAYAQEYRHEASQWVVKAKFDSNSCWRRLPIHEACIRDPSIEIIFTLLESYPDGAFQEDSYDRTPLHYAIIHGASVDVVYLLLEAFHYGKDVQDFFGKTPADYMFNGNNEEGATIEEEEKEIKKALALSHEEISSTVGKINARISHFATIKDNGYRSPNLKARVLGGIFEEELAQARVESDVAYAERDLIMAEKVTLRERITQLEEQLEQKEDENNALSDLSDRNRNLNQLLTKYEKNKKTFVETIHKKDSKIESMKAQFEKEKKVASEEKEKMKITISALSRKLTDVTDDMEKLRIQHSTSDLNDAKAIEKIELLEEMVEVYKNAAHDLQVRCIAHEDRARNEASIGFGIGANGGMSNYANARIAMLEGELLSSSKIRKSLEKEISLLSSYQIDSNQRVDYLEKLVSTYEDKIEKLESGFFTVTGQLVDRTLQMHQKSSTME